MAGQPHVEPGSIVIYVDPAADDAHLFRRAMCCGQAVPDPQTGIAWIPVTRGVTDGQIATLVEETLIVDVRPPSGRVPRWANRTSPVAIFGAALDAAISELDDVDDEDPRRARRDARRILVTLVDTIAPARRALLDGVEIAPQGPVAVALGYLGNALSHVDQGRVDAGRAALRTAQLALTTLLPA